MSATARKWVPDEIVEETALTLPLKESLRILMRGKRMGWVDAMMASRPQMQRHVAATPELRAEAEARYAKTDREARARFEKKAEELYPIPTGTAA